jgi:hypothetical protein
MAQQASSATTGGRTTGSVMNASSHSRPGKRRVSSSASGVPMMTIAMALANVLSKETTSASRTSSRCA